MQASGPKDLRAFSKKNGLLCGLYSRFARKKRDCVAKCFAQGIANLRKRVRLLATSRLLLAAQHSTDMAATLPAASVSNGETLLDVCVFLEFIDERSRIVLD